MNDMMTTPLAEWVHPVLDIPTGGLSRDRTVAAQDLAAAAKTLGVMKLSAVTVTYRIDRLAGGAYRLKGRVTADGEQACVVSLEPVAAHLDETFDVEFWPELKDGDGGEDKTILDERDVECLENGVVPVGRIVFETISAGLDPYPRKPDAEFKWSDKASDAPEKVSPFAALAKLKSKP